MSVHRLLQTVLQSPDLTGSTNSTVTGRSNVPTQIIEALVPGYRPIHSFILVTFGIDVTILVTLFVSIWALMKLGNRVFMAFYHLIAQNYMASLHISSHDDIYVHVMSWLADQPKIKASRSLMAETNNKSAWDVEDEEEQKVAPKSKDGDENSEVEVLNFSNQEAKAPPRYIPAFGTHTFWHKGTYFILQRSHISVFEGSNAATLADKEDLTLSCFGRSPQPLKNLLQDTKDFYLLGHNAKTVIRRPGSKEARRWGARNYWIQIARRPCRPMSTVVLDPKRKAEVLADMNEYLHPATPKWYSNRGIPYRRGYLFHGPPGTGKTSLSFALAGVFGLDIYVISLLEPTLTEEDLGQLFNSLPRRCVVLLEDIDTAGLIRAEKSDEADEASSPNASRKSEDWKMVDLVKTLKKANVQKDEDKKTGISLSGLLNAIDGVASHEGRILVMTTNKPEMLDDALIRPGRVDLQVEFGNATQAQVQELFERMYTVDTPRAGRHTPALAVTAKPAKPAILTPPATPTNSAAVPAVLQSATQTTKADLEQTESKLEDYARAFAAQIPDHMFSPAEIQGFLLKRKKSPQKACAEVGRWVQGMLEVKENKSKVLEVQ